MARDVDTLPSPIPSPAADRLWALFHETWKYFAVSLASLVLDLAVFWALVKGLGVHYLAANVFSVSAGLVLNYTLSVTWVFRHRRLANREAEFAGFVFIGLLGLLVNEAGVALFVAGLALPRLLGKVCAAAISFLFNFGARKALLFSRAG